MRYPYVLALSCALFAFSCQPEQPQGKKNAPMPFFDLAGYFQSQIDQLQAEQPRVEKRIVLDGEEEGKTVEQLNYEKELQVFLKADINRPAWQDQYAIDSVMVNGQLGQLRYIAQDEDLKTRRLIITFEGEEVSKVEIDNYTTSAIANLDQNLTYDPLIGYTIHSKENVQLANAQDLLVEVRFLREAH